MNYYIKLKEISDIKISGSGTVAAKDIKTENMNITISGSGKIDLDIDAKTLKSKVSGSGDFNMSEKADSQEIDISGSGKYLAKNIQSKRAVAEISGSGKIEINAEEELNINISGNGSVFYAGNPKITQKISGYGKIEQIEDFEVETNNSELSEQEAYDIARENDECAKTGILTDTHTYNNSTKTWWIDLERMPELEKDGCNPACVVSEDTKTAEVNWRCTGVVAP